MSRYDHRPVKRRPEANLGSAFLLVVAVLLFATSCPRANGEELPKRQIDTYPSCIPSGTNYLPTPSPCTVKITDPVTGAPELLVMRFMVEEPKALKAGKWPLQDFEKDKKKRKGWVKWLVIAVLL